MSPVPCYPGSDRIPRGPRRPLVRIIAGESPREDCMKIKYIITLVLLLLVIIVTAQNTEIVDFQILFWKVSVSRSIFLAVSVLIGIGIGISLRIRSRKKSAKKTTGSQT